MTSSSKFPQDVLVCNPISSPVSAGRVDLFKHLRIDGSFIVRKEKFQIASRRSCFRFREPVHQFVKLLLAHYSRLYLAAVNRRRRAMTGGYAVRSALTVTGKVPARGPFGPSVLVIPGIPVKRKTNNLKIPNGLKWRFVV
jgi:hypothetical protein